MKNLICVPDEPALVLIIDEVQGITRPGFLDRLDIFFQRHLYEGISTETRAPPVEMHTSPCACMITSFISASFFLRSMS